MKEKELCPKFEGCPGAENRCLNYESCKTYKSKIKKDLEEERDNFFRGNEY